MPYSVIHIQLFTQLFRAFCPCGILEEHKSGARPMQLAYYENLKTLVGSEKYDNRDNFTVVIQPMFVDVLPPIDVSPHYVIIGAPTIKVGASMV